MGAITKRIKHFLAETLFLLLTVSATAQVNTAPPSSQLKNFYNKLAAINLNFIFPEGFKEIKAVNVNNFQFDYAMELPGKDFEIWIQINTQKENEKLANDKNVHTNPDSLYTNIAQLQAIAFSDDKNSFTRRLPPYILSRYNADAGRIYMLNLNDSQITRHYKYALLTILQKNRSGTVSAICFTNEKGPEFFKNLNNASNCLKFKQ